MRVLYLAFADLSEPKAWSVHVRATCRHLQEAGHSVLLIVPAPSRPVDDLEVSHVEVPVKWSRRRALLRFQAHVWRTLPEWTASHGAQVVYARMVPYAWWLPRRVHGLGLAFVVEANGVVLDELARTGASRSRRWLWRKTERRVLEGADGVVAVTEGTEERLRQLYPRISEVAVVRNGVDVERFGSESKQEARAALGLEEGHWIGFVGAFYPYRALTTLVRAMERVRATVPSARLLLVGDGVERAAVEEEVRHAPPGAVRLLGEVPPQQVPRVLAAMDACVLLCTLPRAETAIKLFEYMAARRPVVSSVDAGLGWVEQEGAGVAVGAASVESIAAGIARVLADPTEAAAMGERGRALVERQYTWRGSADAVAAFLEHVLARRRAQDARG